MWIDDQIFSRADRRFHGLYWEPAEPLVVLGRSNQAEVECVLEHCQTDRISVVHRAGGGGTVVLFPGCAILSCGIWVAKPYQNDHYFRLINQALIRTLELLNPNFNRLRQSGISDLSLDGKKCAGTSMFRSRNYLLYQASIIVDCNLEIIERYLRHPSREPQYRQQRSHKDFLVGLSEFSTGMRTSDVVAQLAQEFESTLMDTMQNEVIDPPREQVHYIKEKAIVSGV